MAGVASLKAKRHDNEKSASDKKERNETKCNVAALPYTLIIVYVCVCAMLAYFFLGFLQREQEITARFR